MTKILITGTKESSKDSILDLVLSGSKALPSYKLIDMKPIIRTSIPKKIGEVKKSISFDDFKMKDMMAIKENVNKELDLTLSKAAKKEHVILSGYFTIRTRAGYVPLFTEKVMNKFKPDVIINLELDKNPHLSNNPAEAVRILRHQHANRMLASSYSASVGSILKTIRVHERNIKYAINELTRTLEFYLGI
ncbi:MAG: AAA family ATPase [Candidatus Aenigmatarchaeota archaeon]